MAFPIVPILIVAVAAIAASGRKRSASQSRSSDMDGTLLLLEDGGVQGTTPLLLQSRPITVPEGLDLQAIPLAPADPPKVMLKSIPLDTPPKLKLKSIPLGPGVPPKLEPLVAVPWPPPLKLKAVPLEPGTPAIVLKAIPYIPSGSVDPGAPANQYCQPVANWPADWAAKEQAVLSLINSIRAQGLNCPTGYQPPAPPLKLNAALRCAARKHSKDMADRQYFAHQDPEGLTHGDRIRFAGYDFALAGENISAGRPTPEATVNDGWVGSASGHCENLMNPLFTDAGVGYYYTDQGEFGEYWTLNMAVG